MRGNNGAVGGFRIVVVAACIILAGIWYDKRRRRS